MRREVVLWPGWFVGLLPAVALLGVAPLEAVALGMFVGLLPAVASLDVAPLEAVAPLEVGGEVSAVLR
jgi:hypothetical protein